MIFVHCSFEEGCCNTHDLRLYGRFIRGPWAGVILDYTELVQL